MSKFRSTVSIIATATALLALASCANTIKGVGKDTAGAVNATQSAAHSVERAAKK
ncbi:entericidin [Rhizobium sp. C1]|uniref:entericidin domain-containing protein n=1 Tax=Rhizobium sp. C1 TaxID=1349799 RepID=UPI001E4E26E3|nr:entericidin [Rhizobium sp. C1]MCD2176707.1 entericidin [Rhizobium sp. C1]